MSTTATELQEHIVYSFGHLIKRGRLLTSEQFATFISHVYSKEDAETEKLLYFLGINEHLKFERTHNDSVRVHNDIELLFT